MTAPKPRPSQVAVHSGELTQLSEWFDAPRGRAVLLKGRAGDGRAELADALVRETVAKGDTVVLQGRAPAAGGRSFQVFAEIAQQAMSWADQRRVDVAVTDPVYAELAPVLDGVATNDVPSLEQRLRFFEAFRELLSMVFNRARTLVVIRDFENADADSIELASYLVDELFGALGKDSVPHGLMVFLVRDDESMRASVRDGLTEMAESASMVSLSLDPLSIEDVRTYVQSPEVLNRLLAASNGSPHGLEALIGTLPGNVEELFQRRLEALSVTEQDILHGLAVGGRPASATPLAAVLGQPPQQTAQALNKLKSARILDRRITTGELLFSFARSHDREIASASMSSEKRSRLHAAWAEVLTTRQDRPDFGLLAYHQLRSAEPHRGVALAIRAAESHAVAGALHSAMDILEQALPFASEKMRESVLCRLCELAPLTGSPRRALQHIEEWKKLLPAEARDPALAQEAELLNACGEFRRALEVLGEVGVRTSRVEIISSEAHYHLGDQDLALECCTLALARIEDDDNDESIRLRIDAMNQHGKIALASENLELALAHFEGALEIAERCGSGSDCARARLNVGTTCVRLGDRSRAEEALRGAIGDARGAGNLAALAFATMNLGALQHQCGDLGRAIESYVESRSLFRRLGNRTQLARVLLNLAAVHQLVGDLDRAAELNAEAARLARAGGVERVVALSLLLDGAILADRGEYEAAEKPVRDSIRMFCRLGSQRPVEALLQLTELLVDRGDLEEATLSLEALKSSIERQDRPTHRARAQLIEGRILAQQGAASALDELEIARAELDALGSRLLVRDAELAMADAAHSAGRRSRARIHAEAAAQIHEEIAQTLPAELAAVFETAPIATRISKAKTRNASEPSPSKPLAPVATAFLPEWRAKYGAIVGSSNSVARLFRQIDRVAATETTVLIQGESGTGKELVAQALHQHSARNGGPFVKLNCGALVESLLLSELFGHERGAFTGAHQRKLGRFELAQNGTLFLDEIGDISPATQVALLRVLQERELERVGGGTPIKIDVRVLFATNRDLAEMVRVGAFREDLYYRLKGITIELAPLRKRPEDIPALVHHFLDRYAAETNSVRKRLSPTAMQVLRSYEWPGNIRELEHVVRSAALFTEGPTIEVRNLTEVGGLETLDISPTVMPTVAVEPKVVAEPASADAVLFSRIFDEGIALPDLKREIEQRAIGRALELSSGNISRAAEVLGMKRPRLSQIINANAELKALCQGDKR